MRFNPHYQGKDFFLKLYPHVRKFSAVTEIYPQLFHNPAQTKKATVDCSTMASCAWQRPTLPGPFGPSTIGAG
ncbi:hypothetical protein, partial [Paenibacillus sp. FSL H8-0259]|uniref:hypothetical protein n=1 Tax=Paenibacillus sp. FSL H8-0259 TaxID=1920423 RepID=UPI001C4C8C9D